MSRQFVTLLFADFRRRRRQFRFVGPCCGTTHVCRILRLNHQYRVQLLNRQAVPAIQRSGQRHQSRRRSHCSRFSRVRPCDDHAIGMIVQAFAVLKQLERGALAGVIG